MLKMVKTGLHLQPLRQAWMGYVRFADQLIVKPMISSLLAVSHMSISMCDPLV